MSDYTTPTTIQRAEYIAWLINAVSARLGLTGDLGTLPDMAAALVEDPNDFIKRYIPTSGFGLAMAIASDPRHGDDDANVALIILAIRGPEAFVWSAIDRLLR